MNQKKPSKSEAIGALFARATSENEIYPEGWDQQIHEIIDITKSANMLLCIYSDEGSGKTTFIRQLAKKAGHLMDVIIINPASPSLAPGWISQALAEWVSSDPATGKMLQQKMSALKDSERPIIIAIDSGDLIDPSQMNGDISAVLNLADASELKLSILVVCSERRAEAIAKDSMIGTRMVFRKSLNKLSAEDLLKIIRKKLQKLDLHLNAPNDADLLDMAKTSNGSPTKMAHLICERLGYDMPNLPRDKSSPKTSPALKKSKKNREIDMISFDELLAPKTKD